MIRETRIRRRATGAGLPLITATYLVFVGGLLAGFGGYAWIAIALAAVSYSPGPRLARRPERVALLLVFVAAAIIAASSPPPERALVGARVPSASDRLCCRERERGLHDRSTAPSATTRPWRGRSSSPTSGRSRPRCGTAMRRPDSFTCCRSPDCTSRSSRRRWSFSSRLPGCHGERRCLARSWRPGFTSR